MTNPYDRAETRPALDPDPLTVSFRDPVYVEPYVFPGGPTDVDWEGAFRRRMIVTQPRPRRWQPILAALVTGFVLGALAVMVLRP